MDYFFRPTALRQLKKLPSKIQQRIIGKLDFYVSKPSPLKFADKLTDYRIGERRFRIGDYRVIFDIARDKITILKIGHRKDIYR